MLGRLMFYNYLRMLVISCMIGVGLANDVKGEALFVHTDKPTYFVGENIQFKIYVVSNRAGEGSESMGQLAYLEVLDRKNNPVIQEIVLLADGRGSGVLEVPKQLSSDYYTLRCYTSWMRNFGAESFFHKALTIINPFVSAQANGAGTFDERKIIAEKSPSHSAFAQPETFTITATLNRRAFGKREQVSLVLLTQDSAQASVAGDLSVSVYRVDELQREDNYTIQYLANAESKRSDQDTVIRFLPELEGPIVTGKIVNAYTGEPRPNATVYLSSIGDASVFCIATSDELGNMVFNPPVMIGSHESVLQVLDTGYASQVTLSSPFHETYTNMGLPAFQIGSMLDSLLNEYCVLVQLQNSYTRYDTVLVEQPPPFYDAADKTYYLADYVSFPSLRDIFREYVLEVAPRGSEEDITLKVFNQQEGYMFGRNPLILYDGVPVVQVEKLMDINPREIEKFEIVTSRYHFGDFEFDGILSFFSHNRKFHSHLYDDQSLILDIHGIQQKELVPTIAYGQHYPSRLPDLRNVLYWNPRVYTDEGGWTSLDFFTSDVTGKFLVVVQGIDRTGKVGYASFQFDVR